MTRRYLPIQTPEGGWIKRVDLYLLARMAYEDKVGEEVVDRLYASMCQSDPNEVEFNVLDRDLRDRHVNRNLRSRVLAGQTVLELVRIAASTGSPPSATQAIQLCAFNQWRHEGAKAQKSSLKDQVKKAFQEYRSTSHLQAAQVLADPSIHEIETSEEARFTFLALARGFEVFIDRNAAGSNFKWDPWRVPEVIATNFNFEIPKLNAEECAEIGAI